MTLDVPDDYRDFDTFKCLTKISGFLVNESPLRVGVGREPPLGSPVDLAVFRVNGRPCIPGSSLKGVSRHFAELVAASMGLNVHSPFDFERVDREAEKGVFCEICGIFGSTGIASHIRFYDAYAPPDVRSFIKTGVAIDRDFRGARPEALYNEELIPPGTEWSFRIDIYNIRVYPKPDPEDKRTLILRTVIDTLKNVGLQVCARKTVGEGLIRIKEATVKVFILSNGVLKEEWGGEL